MGKIDRTGETNTNNQGLLMTIVKYNGWRDIDVQFEDGIIVEHRRYDNFKNGTIRNYNYRIGETNTNNQGLLMTIVEYRNSDDIDVQFEDGIIVEHRRYRNFKIGKIANPNYNHSLVKKDRIGETNTNNQGLKMTIIRYNGIYDIDVQFEDGTMVEHRGYSDFKKGKINNPNYNEYDKTGETNTNNQGLLMTIVVYRNSRDIDIQFEDGTIVEHRNYFKFKKGSIDNPNYINYRIDETNTNNQGLLMTIVVYRNSRDIDIQFEDDGTIIEHRRYSDFKNGFIKHPFPYQLPNSDIILENVSYVYKDQVNYLYKCSKCNLEDIDTLENINNHKCK